ncbi:unnamed protein product, partial [Didymodactylos carnosus]
QLSLNALDASKSTIELFISFIDRDHLQSETSGNLLRLLKILHKKSHFTSAFIQIGYPQALFVNDEIVDYVLSQDLGRKSNVVEFFCQLLIKFYNLTRNSNNKSDQLTLLSLCNLLWSISFQGKYKDELQNNSVFMTIIKLLTNDNIDLTKHEYMPRHLSSIRKATEGLLWNLEDKPLYVATPLITAHRSRLLAMNSYSHANILFCEQLVDKIRLMEQFDVWVDYLNYELTNYTSVTHSDDIWEEIANI